MREWEHTGMDFFQIRMDAPRHGSQGGTESEGELMVADPELKPKRPPMYKVILLNDDFTPMDFVVMVLEQIFNKSHNEALEIMLQVHNKGAAQVGIYTRDVAETKAGIVTEHARINEYPLQCMVEKE